jgi:uncharacterized protein (TIGR03067 family)
MSLAIVLALFAVAPAVLAAPGLKEDKNDLKKLQGEWQIESWIQLGQKINVTGTWTFKEDKYTLDQGGDNVEDGTIKLNQKKKPAVMDLEITGGNCAGKNQPGIYKIDGDTLTLCFAWPGVADRPTDFDSTRENRWILITLKRVKK